MNELKALTPHIAIELEILAPSPLTCLSQFFLGQGALDSCSRYAIVHCCYGDVSLCARLRASRSQRRQDLYSRDGLAQCFCTGPRGYELLARRVLIPRTTHDNVCGHPPINLMLDECLIQVRIQIV
ncbi:hypothetical protein GCM10028777_13000 [Angustibacter speluncae]